MPKDLKEKIEELKGKKEVSEEELEELVDEVMDAYDNEVITKDEAIDLLNELANLGSEYASELLEDLMAEEEEEAFEEEEEEE